MLAETSRQTARCAACNADLKHLVEIQARPRSHGLLAFVSKGFAILRCPQCNLMWSDVPPDFDSEQIYTQEYFQGGVPDGYFDYLGSESLLTAEYSNRLQLIRRYKPSGRLLELGCAPG